MRSEICLFDIVSSEATPVLRSDQTIEAPNWAPDGSALIVNENGRIYRVELSAPRLEEIGTEFAISCNNDHGLSPDGKTLVISDKTEEGASCIYTLPIVGGRPRRVTKETPSYWHSCSPDGSTLAFTGKRTPRGFDIYTIPVGGGSETRLTDGFDHADGPDYTPDGRWIWFNGEKAGRMQLWRLHPDGNDLQQMTDDDRWNWFPHPSPDGQHVVYLSYAPGTTGHPRDQDVDLRLMPAEGGRARVLLELFGGQGTINVPSWSPDSRQFAFVRYERP